MRPVPLLLLALLTASPAAAETATVRGTLLVPPSMDAAGIQVRIAATRRDTGPYTPPGPIQGWRGETDAEGSFTLEPRTEGEGHYLVARDPRFDVEVGPLGPLAPGEETELTEFFPVPAELVDDPLPGVEPRMRPKKSGRVKFVYVAGDMGPPMHLEVQVIGDFNDFSPTQGGLKLFDDGSMFEQGTDDGEFYVSGDAVANDGIFTRIVEGLPPGKLRYRLLINRTILHFHDPLEEAGEMTEFGWVSTVLVP